MWFLIRLILFPLKWAMKILAPVSLLLLAALMVYLFFWLPDVSVLVENRPETTTFIELTRDRFHKAGKTGRVQQTWVDLEDISPALVEAVLIAEDDRFYLHQGFDFTELMNAMEANLKADRFVRGGSTISQQLVKNLYLTPEKSYTRKLNEALLTWKIEHSLSKDRILEIYLNVAEWGNGIFGVEEAARVYFKKPAMELTESQAVSLAARLPNPHETRERPLQRRMAREKVILKRLQETKPGYRGTKRPLLAKHQKGDSKGETRLLDSKSLDRMGDLAQKQVDQWWKEFSKSEEPDWKIPTPVSTSNARIARKTLQSDPPQNLASVREEPKDGGTAVPNPSLPSRPAASEPAPSERAERQPEREWNEKIERLQTAASSPQVPRNEEPKQDPPESRERSQEFHERIARLEKLLSKKN